MHVWEGPRVGQVWKKEKEQLAKGKKKDLEEMFYINNLTASLLSSSSLVGKLTTFLSRCISALLLS